MTGPNDPDDPEDWAFPQVQGAPEAEGPASVELPAQEDQVYDTGSDAWWRAQARAHKAAAAGATGTAQESGEPPEPAGSVPTPLDRDWLPADLRQPDQPASPDLPVAEPLPTDGPAAEPTSEAVDSAAEPAAYVAATRVRPAVGDLPPPLHVPLMRPAGQPGRISPGRAVAGALLAVLGVGLAVLALLLVGGHDSAGTPTVQAPPGTIATTVPTSTPSVTPSVTPAATLPVTPTKPATGTPRASAKAAPVPPSASPVRAPVLPVSVLNNSRIKGLAERATGRFRSGGWPVPISGNYRGGTIANTTVYYGVGQLPSARRFASQFGIGRIAPRFRGLPGSGLTVVLTRSFR